MKKILVSGFEPFNTSSSNPSQAVVEALREVEFEGLDVRLVVLPVEYDRSFEVLCEHIEAFTPDAVISFGQAEGRTHITPERISVNLDQASIADNAGVTRAGTEIEAGLNDGYFSTLPINEILHALSEAGIPTVQSMTAGTFVCNHIFYRTQALLADTSIKSGFVHIPLMELQAAEFPGLFTMPLAELVKAAEIIIRTTARAL